ncbi:ClC family H(+)/Cl(-) exchange transporter [Lactobacillus salivarius]|uniref:ClC family H(+)/Cl(-) exchange transporter n=1 Tax=Ligilactobacillus salivarius TaxID=1624 RepID=A0ABD6JA84_9LACO|nr:ClC family H(+)/Cl(-) exchange transporter [Ligilactobacillus salivarius]MYZ65449.1 ClC family H(+)/Cl(-) exchange transporter [Ligilactobacillus salivarius]
MKFDTSRFIFIVKGLLVGAAVGIVVSLFRLLIEKFLVFIKFLFMQAHNNLIYFIILAIIMLVSLIANSKFIKDEPNIKGSGIPQVEGQLAGELEMNWWSVLWRKWVGGILSIGIGLFLGREGPSIQLGAAVGQGIAERTNHRGSGRRILIAGGASAGLSAAFNAPIASTLFILEEVYHNFSPLVWTTSLAAAIAANFVSLNFFGLTPVLHMSYKLAFPIHYYIHLVLLGIFLGLLGYVYQYLTLNVDRFYKLFKFIPSNWLAINPIILLFPLGYFLPDTLGGGNSLILEIGGNIPTVWLLLGIFLLRLLFSTLSYGSGLPGGIFLPILTIGATLGALYGVVAAHFGLLPDKYIVDCIIYAMAGYFACIGKAPFTAILLITEMVGSLHHLMPLAVVSLTAYTVVDLLRGRPIYEALLEKSLKRYTPHPDEFTDQLEIPVFAGSYLQDKQVRDITWPKECLLVAIQRGEKQTIPHGDTLIRSGDTLVIETGDAHRAEVARKIGHVANDISNWKN